MAFRLRAGICLGLASVSIMAVGACARSAHLGDWSLQGKKSAAASPRVVAFGQPVPKGGGVYKLGQPYQIDGQWHVPQEDPAYNRTGVASFYGIDFHGRRTANGEIYDMGALTAAHPTLPLPCYAYVTNLDNGRTILVRINDRGPYVNNRIIDLSQAAARELGYQTRGLARVRVRYAGPAPLNGDDIYERRFLASQPWHRLALSWPAPNR
jgi:rare lipoprotein A